MRISRASIVHIILLLFAAALIGQAARVQLVHGKEWAEKAKNQQFRKNNVAAARGNIFDAAGNILAESREVFRISIAPGEIKDPAIVVRDLRDAGVRPEWIRASVDKRRKWITLPGLYFSADVSDLISRAGVHPVSVMSREYAIAPGIRRIVGALDASGRAVGGIEQALDSILRGDSAVAAVARDVHGRRLDSPNEWTSIPRAGSNVTLTINRDLQDICERALARAVDSLGAQGGDIVVMNPINGEVLAMASDRRAQKSFSITAVTEPFEPGSTLKPFIAAELFEKGRARADEVVDTHNGKLVLNKRIITDLHTAKSMTLADVIRFSSNIGIVEFGSRLNDREKYELLRDLGMGVQTGVPLPGESDGTLEIPDKWRDGVSSASLSMGYEIAVTPLQLASAYSVLANGGELVQPQIVKEIRAVDGTLLYESKKRVVRRVFSEQTTDKVRELLKAVVESGTAIKADLASFALMGKTGTARRVEKGKGYVEGSYTASFVGVFPADRPQYVVLVKLDAPQRSIYGGDVAAPVSAVVLRAAIAARDAALDRSALASVERDVPLGAAKESAKAITSLPKDSARGLNSPIATRSSTGSVPATSSEPTPQGTRLVALPYVKSAPKLDTSLRPVPDVTGFSTRAAVRALHEAGFRVTLGSSLPSPTVPVAGTLLPAGTVVKLQHTQ